MPLAASLVDDSAAADWLRVLTVVSLILQQYGKRLMSSKMDVYAPCPCGSGKKVKFCCNAALAEMDKVARLHESRQTRQALEALEKVAEKYPDAPIVTITRAQLLMEERRFDEAANTTREFLKAQPNNSHATGLLAYARFMDVGFHEAKPEIHRAFQVCPQSSPDVIGSLASQIADDIFYSSSMSAREHLGLALRLTQDQEERQSLFQELMRIDGSPEIPYPLRGPHSLAPLNGPEGTEKDIKTAVRLSSLGCWEIAAKLLHKLTDQMPDDPALWKNIGLCRAWDADNSGAADALHKAAELAETTEQSIECETLAQLLELSDIEDQASVKAARYRLKSTSMTLTTLDGCDRAVRLPDSGEREDDGVKIAGRYLILDQAFSEEAELDEASAPNVLAEASVFDLNTQDGAVGVLSVIGVEGEARDSATTLVEEVLVEQLTRPEGEEEDADGPLYSESLVRTVLKELLPSQSRKYYGKSIDVVQRREIAKRDGTEFVENTWCNTALNRLGGKTPREAAEEPALKVKLAAALHVLEAVSDAAMLYGDMSGLRASLNIEPEAAVELRDDLQLNAQSVMESHRLPLSDLSDDQLGHIVHRALLIRHVPFAYAVLKEVASRGVERIQGIDQNMFLWTIAQVCRELGYHEEALKWLKEGREEIEKGDNFEEKLNWTMRELQFRIEDRNDPELIPLVDHLWNYYGEKLPTIREAMEPTLKELGIPVPGESAGGLVLPDGSSATAQAAAPSGGGESKLWLPGQ